MSLPPLRFTDEPTFREDKPVKSMWVVLTEHSTVMWGAHRSESGGEAISAGFDTREEAERHARMHDDNCGQVVAIVQMIYQEGDHIQDYDPKRSERVRKERDAEIVRQYNEMARTIRFDGEVRPWGIVGPRGADLVQPSVIVNPGDGIGVALNARQQALANRQRTDHRPAYQRINEGHRRSAALHGVPSKRGQRP